MHKSGVLARVCVLVAVKTVSRPVESSTPHPDQTKTTDNCSPGHRENPCICGSRRHIDKTDISRRVCCPCILATVRTYYVWRSYILYIYTVRTYYILFGHT